MPDAAAPAGLYHLPSLADDAFPQRDADGSRRPSTVSTVHVVADRRWLGRWREVMYPVNSPYTETSMRPKAKLCRQRLVFAIVTVGFVAIALAIYVGITLPTQGILSFPAFVRRSAPSDEHVERAPIREERLARFGVGYYDVRGMYDRFNKLKRNWSEADVVKPSDVKDQSYQSYVRLVKGLRDLSDYVVSSLSDNGSSPDASHNLKAPEPYDEVGGDVASRKRRQVLAHTLRFVRSLETSANTLVASSGVEARARRTVEGLQRRLWSALERLQNPANCSVVTAIRCRLTNPNGFASCVHDVLHCLVAGLQRNRTVILDTTRWHYTKSVPWTDVLKPLSRCQHAAHVDYGYPQMWSKERVHMTMLPRSIGRQLIAVHGDPVAWFYGILMSYILRPAQPKFGAVLGAHLRSITKDQHTAKHDYVGVHIRLTDKRSEAAPKSLALYMVNAEQYFERVGLERNVAEKQLYVATDEPRAVELIKLHFPTFSVAWNQKASRQANRVSRRSTDDSLKEVLKDLWALSRSSHLICTLSSGFGRVAYELMQSVHWDAWRRVSSLDDDLYYAYSLQPDRVPREPYEDNVFDFEHAPFSMPPKPHRYQDAAHRYHVSGMSNNLRDGFELLNDVSGSQARFKTEQPVRLMKYAAEV